MPNARKMQCNYALRQRVLLAWVMASSRDFGFFLRDKQIVNVKPSDSSKRLINNDLKETNLAKIN